MQYLEGTLEGKLVRGYSAYDIAKQHGFDGTELEWLASLKGIRVKPIGDTKIAAGTAIEVVGIPEYVENTELYPEFGLTDEGWYAFARIKAPTGEVVTESTTVVGAAGFIAEPGSDFVEVAVKFGAAAMSVPVVVNWSESTETFIFKATDLAVRNLDYRVTFYMYDADKYVSWEFVLTTDTKFVDGKIYFTFDGETYSHAEVTAGESVPADTYYVHSKVTIEGLTRNVTYRLNEVVDCPMVFMLPEIEDDEHGAWYEIRCRHADSYSMTLIPPSEDVKVASEHSQAETKGINMINLHYTAVAGAKVWRFMNTHSSIPA
ncbi:MAG: hypothetical protein IJV14_15430 [Lachnospiraceae bacterium]|nr:hypothetical protein [Lachnospiraceae bacterium]